PHHHQQQQQEGELAADEDGRESGMLPPPPPLPPRAASEAALSSLAGVRQYDRAELDSAVVRQLSGELERRRAAELAGLRAQLARIESDADSARRDLASCEAQLDAALRDAESGSCDPAKTRRIRSMEAAAEARVRQLQTLEARRRATKERIEAASLEAEAVAEAEAAGTTNRVAATGDADCDMGFAGVGRAAAAPSIERPVAVKRPAVCVEVDPSSTRSAPATKRSRQQQKQHQQRRRQSVRLVEESPPESPSSAASSELHQEAQHQQQQQRARPLLDDASLLAYERRIARLNRSELIDRQVRLEDGGSDIGDDFNDESDDSPMQLEGLPDGLAFALPRKVWQSLFPYQRVAVRWLRELHSQGVGGIMGDQMGLGKTVQMIALLAGLSYSHNRLGGPRLGPVLIACPGTVLQQWLGELRQWYPRFRVAILHSTGSGYSKPAKLVHSIANHPGILLTTYNTLTMHRDVLLKYRWDYVILDEGHRIKNPTSDVTIACKQFPTPHRIIISGTPMQNNLKELWSLFDFVYPGKLGDLQDFMQHLATPILQGGYASASKFQVELAYRCACSLRDTINPYLLRRMKEDVRLQLPGKSEQVLFCRLSDYQRDVYKEYLASRECRQILEGRYMVFPGLSTLRKICNHPDLSTGPPQKFGLPSRESLTFGYYKRSGKMLVVDALLKAWRSDGHKVLLFSQSRRMLGVLEAFVKKRGYPYMRMDGGTAVRSRQTLVHRFNTDPGTFVFLLTSRVGGIGVNLTGANRVIIFDPDWNPCTDLQARERAWRIGQQRDVVIYRLLSSGTIEEKVYHRQIFKQFLANRILRDPRQRRFFKANNLDELFALKDDVEGTETRALFTGTGASTNRFDALRQRQEAAGVDLGAASDSEAEMASTDVDAMSESSASDAPAAAAQLTDSRRAELRELARKLSAKVAREFSAPSGADAEPAEARGPAQEKSRRKEKKQKKKKKKSKDKSGGDRKRARGAKRQEVDGHRIEFVVKQAAFDYGDGQRGSDKTGAGPSTSRDAADSADPLVSALVPRASQHRLEAAERSNPQIDAEVRRVLRKARLDASPAKRKPPAALDGKAKKLKSKIAKIPKLQTESKAASTTAGPSSGSSIIASGANNKLERALIRCGVQDAVLQEVIEAPGPADVDLVEWQASETATAAVAALRDRLAASAAAAAAAGPVKQFGRVRRCWLWCRLDDSTAQGQVESHFSGAALLSTGRVRYSSDDLFLLIDLRLRRQQQQSAGLGQAGGLNRRAVDLASSIRVFHTLVQDCRRDSSEIARHFSFSTSSSMSSDVVGEILRPDEGHLLRALLRQMCDFDRPSGMWTLKPEFR
ncbi:hypothetical protein BOX15_Mlig019797g3, partial [Macrostomum lignano]